jgi:hypothetical protein
MKPANGTRDQHTSGPACAHVFHHVVKQIQRAGDVRVDHVRHVLEPLVEKGLAETMPRVGEQRIDLASRSVSN